MALISISMTWTVSGADFACNKGHFTVDGVDNFPPKNLLWIQLLFTAIIMQL